MIDFAELDALNQICICYYDFTLCAEAQFHLPSLRTINVGIRNDCFGSQAALARQGDSEKLTDFA
jgi:hypothetical protein